MALDVDNNKKMLLLLGIGMFTNENEINPRYMEIMKKLAYEQQLYVILVRITSFVMDILVKIY